MIKILIWGIGKVEKRFRRYLNVDRASIVAYTSKDSTDGYVGGVKIVNPEKINSIDYDFIIVATSFYKEIEKQLVELGVPKQRIRQVYDKEKYKDDDVIKDITYWNYTCSNHEYEIGNYRIDLGCDHMLPAYQLEYPMYDCFLGELSKHLDDNEWAIDIGANVGDSVFLLRKNSNIRILAVEPVSQYFDLLCRNISQIENVYPRQYVISMHEQKYKLTKHNGTAYVNDDFHNDLDNIQSITLKHLLEVEKIELNKIRLIKIDTDGFDAECLMSLQAVIKRINAFLYFENYSCSKEIHDKFEQAYVFLEENGYRHFFLFDNFGNFLCEGNVNTIKDINGYLLRERSGNSADAIGYVDVLAVGKTLYKKAKSAVKEYVDFFDNIETY